MADSENRESASAAHLPRKLRVLACHQCQQRKIKCNRSFPCINCTKARLTCVPATITARRKRRHFPENELLDRIRRYEDLLRRNHITFDAIDSAIIEAHSPGSGSKAEHLADSPSSSRYDAPSPAPSEVNHEPKDLWRVINQDFRSRDNDYNTEEHPARQAVAEEPGGSNWMHDNLLFGTPAEDVDLRTLHPDAVHTFRLWQIYLDSVNPLLKVIHAPTLQAKIVDAAARTTSLDRHLEALLFAIYYLAIHSLDPAVCEMTFASTKDELLARYRFACEQALLRCSFLKTTNRDCLTALFLYVSCVRDGYDARAQSALLAIAVRIAQRMGLHSEKRNMQQNVLEAELRRRLWWGIAILDARVSELSDHRTTSLLPLWDCAIPANINDSDLRPEMKAAPPVHTVPTDSIFVAIRCELADFLRHSPFHLDFLYPALMTLESVKRRTAPAGEDSIAILQKSLYERYLQRCNPENPLQLLVLHHVRHMLARYYVLRFYAQCHDSPMADRARDDAIDAGLTMIMSDTDILSSPLTKPFRWIFQQNFPFLAYVLIIQQLKRTPEVQWAQRCWEVIGENFNVRFETIYAEHPSFRIFGKLILDGWEIYQAALQSKGQDVPIPRIIQRISVVRSMQVTSLNKSGDQDEHTATTVVAPNMFDSAATTGLDLSLASFPDMSVDFTQYFDSSTNDIMAWPGFGWMPAGMSTG